MKMSRKKLHKKEFDEMKIFRKGFAVAMAVNETSVSATSTKSGKCGKDVKWSYKNKVTNRKTPTNFLVGVSLYFYCCGFPHDFLILIGQGIYIFIGESSLLFLECNIVLITSIP